MGRARPLSILATTFCPFPCSPTTHAPFALPLLFALLQLETLELEGGETVGIEGKLCEAFYVIQKGGVILTRERYAELARCCQ